MTLLQTLLQTRIQTQIQTRILALLLTTISAFAPARAVSFDGGPRMPSHGQPFIPGELANFKPGKTGKACNAVYGGSLAALESARPPDVAALEVDFVSRLNAFRRENKLAEVVPLPGLKAAATIHSFDMASRKYLAHISPDGCTPADRIFSFGRVVTERFVENIAAGQDTAESVLELWKADPPHRANLLDPVVRAVGVAAVPASAEDKFGGSYWTLDLAK